FPRPPDAHLNPGEWALKPAVVTGWPPAVSSPGQHVEIDLLRILVDDPDFEDPDLGVERKLFFGFVVGAADLDDDFRPAFKVRAKVDREPGGCQQNQIWNPVVVDPGTSGPWKGEVNSVQDLRALRSAPI